MSLTCIFIGHNSEEDREMMMPVVKLGLMHCGFFFFLQCEHNVNEKCPTSC